MFHVFVGKSRPYAGRCSSFDMPCAAPDTVLLLPGIPGIVLGRVGVGVHPALVVGLAGAGEVGGGAYAKSIKIVL